MLLEISHLKILSDKVELIDSESAKYVEDWKDYSTSSEIFKTLKSSFEEYLHVQAYVQTEEDTDKVVPIQIKILNEDSVWHMETNLLASFPGKDISEIESELKDYMRLVPPTIVDFAKRTFPEKFEKIPS